MAASRPHIHILGAGSIGSLIAHSLSTLPSPPLVTLLLRPPSLAAPSTQNLDTFRPSTKVDITLIHSTNYLPSPSTSSGIPALYSPLPSSYPPLTNLIITTKAQQTLSALRPLVSHIDESTCLLFLQNGMGAIDEVRQGIWSNSSTRNVPTMIAGITTHGVKRLPMGGKHDIELAGLGHIEIGYSSVKDTLENHTHPTLLLNELQRSSLLSTAILPPHVFLLHQLYKLATNAAINPLTAIFKVPNGDILKSLPLVEQILDEVTRVFLKLPETCSEAFNANGNKEDILSTHALVERTKDLAERTAGNTSSMLADVLAGRETEVEYINGWVVRKGKELGVECPVNEELMDRVKELHVRS